MVDREPVLVIGASGRVGGEVARLLLARGESVRAFTRDASKVHALVSAGAEVCIGDLGDRASVVRALAGVRRAMLLSALDPPKLAHAPLFAEEARRLGLLRIVNISGKGAAAEAPVEVLRWHARADQALDAVRLPVVHLRPGTFMQNLLEDAGSVRERSVLPNPFGRGRVPWIDARDVAAAAAHLLCEDVPLPDCPAITSNDCVTMADVARLLENLLGREVRLEDRSPAAMRASLLAWGVPDSIAAPMEEIYTFYREGNRPESTPDFQRLMGRPPRGLETFLRDHLEAFR
ncbi:MAG: NAD(P)H-binding protein [Sumerlaeia bacterium]